MSRFAHSDDRQRRDLQRLSLPRARLLIRKTAATSAAEVDIGQLLLCNPTGGAFAVQLPSAANRHGLEVGVKNITASTNAITITPVAGETIDGAASYAMTVGYTAITMLSDGENWIIV
jgi:hypothetical protein